MALLHNGNGSLITSRPPHPPAIIKKLMFTLPPGGTPPSFVPPPSSPIPAPPSSTCEADNIPSVQGTLMKAGECNRGTIDTSASSVQQDTISTVAFNSEGCLDYVRALRELTTFSWRRNRSYRRPIYPSSALLPLGAPGDCASRLQGRPSMQYEKHGGDESSNAAEECLFAYELVAGKSLNTHPSGRPWRSSFERVCTPCSLEDLGALDIHNGAPITPSAAAESTKASAAIRAALSAKIATGLQSFTLGPPITMPALHQLLDYPSRVLLPYCLCPALQAMLLVQHAPGYRPTSATSLVVGQRNSVTKVVAVPWECAVAIAESLPEASQLGPVLMVHTTGRCGSTLLMKALDSLDCAQSASEPEIFTDVHEMLERGLLTRPHALSLLRAACLLLIHRLRADRPGRPLVVLKPRNLTAIWRAAELLPEALPDAKNILMWRRVDGAVGSFDAAVMGAMESPLARAMHSRSLDGRLWPNGIKAFMKHLTHLMAAPVQTLKQGSSRSSCLGDKGGCNVSEDSSENDRKLDLLSVTLDAEVFSRHGSLGFNALTVMFAFHTAANLHRGLNIWDATLSFDSLMRGRSALLRRLLVKFKWLSLLTAETAANLGTSRADTIFSKDGREPGRLIEFNGDSIEQGNISPVEASQNDALVEESVFTETEHTPCSEDSKPSNKTNDDVGAQLVAIDTTPIDASAEGFPVDDGEVSPSGTPDDTLVEESTCKKAEQRSLSKDGASSTTTINESIDAQQASDYTTSTDAPVEEYPADDGGEKESSVGVPRDALVEEMEPAKQAAEADVAPVDLPTGGAPADNEGHLIDEAAKYWGSRRPLPDNEHLSKRRAEALAMLLGNHGPLAEAGYDLSLSRALR